MKFKSFLHLATFKEKQIRFVDNVQHTNPFRKFIGLTATVWLDDINYTVKLFEMFAIGEFDVENFKAAVNSEFDQKITACVQENSPMGTYLDLNREQLLDAIQNVSITYFNAHNDPAMLTLKNVTRIGISVDINPPNKPEKLDHVAGFLPLKPMLVCKLPTSPSFP